MYFEVKRPSISPVILFLEVSFVGINVPNQAFLCLILHDLLFFILSLSCCVLQFKLLYM